MTSVALDVDSVRADFPILKQQIHGRPLVYLDSGASAQKPEVVTQAVSDYYRRDHSNVHRGVHTLSQRATAAYEAVREKVCTLLNAARISEIIYVSGTTAAINLVAQTYGRANLSIGSEVLVTEMEHHANIVPWQIACELSGATLKVVPFHDNGVLDLDQYRTMLSDNTRIVAVTHVSNALGTINPMTEMIRLAHDAGAVVLVDGAQAVPHMAVDVQALDCDFYAFSAHKLYGPTGFGILYGKESLLEAMPPWQGGGDMIKQVRFAQTTYNDLPYKFEAGTPHIAGAVGLGAAIDYVSGHGLGQIAAHERALLDYAQAQASAVSGLQVFGTAPDKAAVLSFALDGIHAHDVGTVLDHEGVAVRAGHHCAMPVMEHFGVAATVRASFGMYNNYDDVDALLAGIARTKDLMSA